MPSPSSLDLADVPDPRYLGCGALPSPNVLNLDECQVQALWIWQTCQTHATLDVVRCQVQTS